MAAFVRTSHSPAVSGCQARIVAALYGALLCAGCSTSLDPDRVSTGSVAPGIVANASALSSDAGSDWDAIARTVGPSPISASEALPWSNEITGHAGTIQNVVSSRNETGRACKTFMTTVSAVGGIQGYKATLCRLPSGLWDYSSITPLDDATLLPTKG